MNFLKNEKNLYIMPFLYLIATAVYYICMVPDTNTSIAVTSLIEVVTVLLLIAIIPAYRKDENNMMKTIFGAILMERVFNGFGVLVNAISGNSSDVAVICGVLYLVLYLVFFIVHISIDIKDVIAPKKVAINTIVGAIIVVDTIALCSFSTNAATGVMPFIAAVFQDITMMIELLCIERQLKY